MLHLPPSQVSFVFFDNAVMSQRHITYAWYARGDGHYFYERSAHRSLSLRVALHERSLRTLQDHAGGYYTGYVAGAEPQRFFDQQW